MWLQLGISNKVTTNSITWAHHYKARAVSVLLQIQVPDHTQHWSSLALHCFPLSCRYWFLFRISSEKVIFTDRKWDIGTQEALNMGLFTCKLMTGIFFQEMQNAATWLYSHKGRLYSLWNSHFGSQSSLPSSTTVHQWKPFPHSPKNGHGYYLIRILQAVMSI